MLSKISIKYKLLLPIFLLGLIASISIIWLLLSLQNLSKNINVVVLYQEELTQIILLNLVVVTISAVVFIIISYKYGKQIVQNIAQVKHAIDAVAEGNFEEKVEFGGDDEFGELSHKINEVITDLMVSNAALMQKTDVLEQENVKNEAILTNIGDGLIITDAKRKITLVNTAASKMLGWTSDELVGYIWPEEKFLMTDEFDHEISAEDMPISKAFSEQQVQKTTINNAYYYERKNGTTFPVAITASPIIINDEMIGAIIIFRDITSEKEIDAAKTEFVSLASHQLRTPLTSINWYTEMLLAGDAGKTNDQQLKYLSEIYRGSQRMVNLVNSLLNASRIELGTLRVIPEPIDLRHVTDSVLNELAPLIEEKALKIEKKYTDIPEIDLDPNLIRVVFQNVLSNAVIYTPQEGEIIVGFEAKEHHVLSVIKDTGYGIPLDQQDKIFTKLFRADNVQQLDTNGSGLGLYISKSIIEHARGKIWFESEPDKGTTFFISVPYAGMREQEGSKGLE